MYSWQVISDAHREYWRGNVKLLSMQAQDILSAASNSNRHLHSAVRDSFEKTVAVPLLKMVDDWDLVLREKRRTTSIQTYEIQKHSRLIEYYSQYVVQGYGDRFDIKPSNQHYGWPFGSTGFDRVIQASQRYAFDVAESVLGFEDSCDWPIVLWSWDIGYRYHWERGLGKNSADLTPFSSHLRVPYVDAFRPIMWANQAHEMGHHCWIKNGIVASDVSQLDKHMQEHNSESTFPYSSLKTRAELIDVENIGRRCSRIVSSYRNLHRKLFDIEIPNDFMPKHIGELIADAIAVRAVGTSFVNALAIFSADYPSLESPILSGHPATTLRIMLGVIESIVRRGPSLNSVDEIFDQYFGAASREQGTSDRCGDLFKDNRQTLYGLAFDLVKISKLLCKGDSLKSLASIEAGAGRPSNKPRIIIEGSDMLSDNKEHIMFALARSSG